MQRLVFFAAFVVGALATSATTSAVAPHDFAGPSGQTANVPQSEQFRVTDSAITTDTTAQEPTPGVAVGEMPGSGGQSRDGPCGVHSSARRHG
jgi:hypothetical protein